MKKTNYIFGFRPTALFLTVFLSLSSSSAAAQGSEDAGTAASSASKTSPEEKTGVKKLPLSCAEIHKQNADDLPARLCASMSLEDKISQMFMSYPPLDKTGPVTVGAVIMLGPVLKSGEKIAARAQDLQKRAKIPLIVAVDMEGGQLNRLQAIPALKDAPSGKKLGEMSEADAEAWGETLGSEMKNIGINCNLGPVLDLAQKGHMFDRERSMGGDPDAVAKVASAYVKGMWKYGVAAFGKHFPGYGETAQNSDHDLVLSTRSEAEIKRQAQPFFSLGSDLSGVLLTNIAFKERGGIPAILSGEMVDMAHAAQPDWVTMTDDIAVAPLLQATGGDAAEVVRKAFHAGNDIILTTAPIDWEKALDLRGIIRGEIKARPELERRVDQSVMRILRLKEKMGLLNKFKKKSAKKKR